MDNQFKITDDKLISLSKIPSDVHQLGLPQNITKLLIDSGVFFISQIEQMDVYSLTQLSGIDKTTASKIKQALYRERWSAIQNKTISSMDELKLLIDRSPRKKDICKITIDEFKLPATALIAFSILNIRTIGDILQLSEIDIFKIKGIGLFRYHEILNSILKVAASIEEEIIDVKNFPPPDPLDDRMYIQSNITFPEVFTMLLNRFSPRDRTIFFEYFFTNHAQHRACKGIAQTHDLSRERIRQICEKGLRVLRHPRRINCITVYLNTVWKAKVQNFVIVNGGYVTRSELEQEFADDISEIYFLQNKILCIQDIWANILVKNEPYYYLPSLQRDNVKRIEQAISEQIKKVEWGIDIRKLAEIIDNQLALSQSLGDRSQDIIAGIIRKFDLLEIAGDEVRLAMRRSQDKPSAG